MDIPENAPVWEINEPPQEFKVDRSHDVKIIDQKIAKLEAMIARLSDSPSPKFVGAGTSILDIDTGSVRQKYEAMLMAEEKRRKETIIRKNEFVEDHQGFEERIAFIQKAKESIEGDTYLLEEILGKNSGRIDIDYYNCDPERESLEQIIANISQHVETPPEIKDGTRYLTYHIKAEAGKDLFLIYSEETGHQILRNDFGETPAGQHTTPTKVEKIPATQVAEPIKNEKPSRSDSDYQIDKLIYQLIFDAIQLSYPKKKDLHNVNFIETYSKLSENDDIKEKLLQVFDKLSISGTKDSRTMMAAEIEHKVATVFTELVKKASIREELKKLENWLNDDKTLDKSSMRGSAIARHNAIGHEAREGIEEKEDAYRLYNMIIGYKQYFNTRFPYCVDYIWEHGHPLTEQRKKDTSYYVKPCPPLALFQELTTWRNKNLKALLDKLQAMNLRGAKNAERGRIVKDIGALAHEMKSEITNIEKFDIEKLHGKEYFEQNILELERRAKALSH